MIIKERQIDVFTCQCLYSDAVDKVMYVCSDSPKVIIHYPKIEYLTVYFSLIWTL